MRQDRELRIIFVCTANVCRSPMAEAMMSDQAAAAGVHVGVSSAGIDSEIRMLHPMVTKILGEHGAILGPRKSQPLFAELVDWADLILTMTGEHAIAAAAQFRDARKKVFMLDHFVKIALPLADGESVDEWLAAIFSQPRAYPSQPGAEDVPDPIGQDEQTFRAVAATLDSLTYRIAKMLTTASE